MSAEILFTLIFLSQVTLVSVLLPAKLIRLLHRASPTGVGVRSGTPSFSTYRVANGIVALMSLGLLCAIFYFRVFEQTTATLALTGLSFLCQLLPLVFLRTKLFGAQPTSSDAPLKEEAVSHYRTLRLFQATSPITLGVAAVLFIAYIGFQLTGWNGGWDVHSKKIIAALSTNLFFVGTIAFSFSSLKRCDINLLAGQYRSAIMGANLIIFCSIMISVYSFLKEVIFIFDLDHLRPAMMSAFLHIPALFSFNMLFFSGQVRKD